jgi:transposase
MLTEGFKDSEVGRVSEIIGNKLSKELGVPVVPFHETHFYENGDGVGKGLLYFINNDASRSVRFNMSDRNNISSVDIWKNATKETPTPDSRIDVSGKYSVETINIVLPIIKDLLEGSTDEEDIDFAKLVDEVDMEMKSSDVEVDAEEPEQLAASVETSDAPINEEIEVDGDVYPDNKSAIKALLSAGMSKAEIAKQMNLSYSAVRHHAKKIEGVEVVDGVDEQRVEAVADEEPQWINDISEDEYNKMIEDAGSDPWNLSIGQKKERYREMVDRFVDPEGSAKAKLFVVCGSPATGKTYDITSIMENDYKMVEGKDYSYNKGESSNTSAKLFAELYNNREEMVIVFDDADDAVTNSDTRQILMAATDTSTSVVQVDNRQLTFSKSKVQRRMDNLKNALRTVVDIQGRGDFEDDNLELGADEITELIRQFSVAERFAKMDEYDFNELWLEKAGEILNSLSPIMKDSPVLKQQLKNFTNLENEYIRIKNKERLPNKFEFKSKIIVITNMVKEKIDGALLSRAMVQEIIVDQDEMLDLIRTILPYMRPDDADLKIKEIILKTIMMKESRNPSLRSNGRYIKYDIPDKKGRLPTLPINPRRIYFAIDEYLAGGDYRKKIFLHG